MKLKLLAVAAAAIVNGGCASTITAQVDESVRQTDRAAVSALDSLRAGEPVESVTTPAASVRRIDSYWVPVSKVSEEDYRTAPILNRNVVVNRHITGLTEAASYITLLTGVPVSVATRPLGQAGTQGASQPTAQGGQLPPIPSGTQMPAGFQPQQTVDPVGFISYSGKMAGLLDVLAARFGVYWEPEKDGVRFFYTKSRTFRLSALPGNSSMSSSVGTQSSGGGGSGGGTSSGGTSSSSSEQRSGIKFDGLSVWQSIEDGIKTMLTAQGRVVVTPATGTVTVDDTPPTLERVAKFIADQNDGLTRQVVMNVRVLSVELNDSDSYGVNWNAVYQNVGRGLGVALNSVSGLPGGSPMLAFNVVNTNSMWDGTKAMLEALSKQGRVSQITSASIVTINNQPAPIQVGRQRSYLASSTTTLGTGGAGNTTTLVPGVVTTGFSMSVLPHILDNGRMMLQYAGDISTLVDIATVSSGSSSIQTPEIDTRNFLQRVMLNNGETLVLTGFEQFGQSGSKQGVGSANNLALGGSAKASNSKTVLVVLIQPVMIAGER